MLRFLNTLVAPLRKFAGDRRRFPRRGARFVARLPFFVSPLRDGQDFAPGHSLEGRTRDISSGGLTLLLPAMRVGGLYLTDAGGYLVVRVETPNGSLRMLTAPARFEQIDGAEDGYGYLIGVRIIKMGDEDRSSYMAYLKTLARSERRAEERAADSSAESWSSVTPSYVAEAFDKYLRQERAR